MNNILNIVTLFVLNQKSVLGEPDKYTLFTVRVRFVDVDILSPEQLRLCSKPCIALPSSAMKRPLHSRRQTIDDDSGVDVRIGAVTKKVRNDVRHVQNSRDVQRRLEHGDELVKIPAVLQKLFLNCF